MEKTLLRPAEIAEALGVGRSTVYEMVRRGELQAMRVGRSIRVPLAAWKAWVARQGDLEPRAAGAGPASQPEVAIDSNRANEQHAGHSEGEVK